MTRQNEDLGTQCKLGEHLKCHCHPVFVGVNKAVIKDEALPCVFFRQHFRQTEPSQEHQPFLGAQGEIGSIGMFDLARVDPDGTQLIAQFQAAVKLALAEA